MTPFLKDVTFEFNLPMGFNPLPKFATELQSLKSSPDCNGYAVKRLPCVWGTAFERKAGLHFL